MSLAGKVQTAATWVKAKVELVRTMSWYRNSVQAAGGSRYQPQATDRLAGFVYSSLLQMPKFDHIYEYEVPFKLNRSNIQAGVGIESGRRHVEGSDLKIRKEDNIQATLDQAEGMRRRGLGGSDLKIKKVDNIQATLDQAERARLGIFDYDPTHAGAFRPITEDAQGAFELNRRKDLATPGLESGRMYVVPSRYEGPMANRITAEEAMAKLARFEEGSLWYKQQPLSTRIAISIEAAAKRVISWLRGS